jgi:Zn-dependent protease
VSSAAPRQDPPVEESAPPPPAPDPAPPSRKGVLTGAAALGAALLAKLKGAGAILGWLLWPLKLLKLGKFWLTVLSMATMIAFEAQRGGVAFGVGFVVLLLIHELGHGFAIRQAGLHAGWPVFIPFLGAVIALKGQPSDRQVEARIAIAGPVAGTVGAMACAALFLLTHGRLWLGLAHVGFFLNLFNLVPMSPLDGGRVAQAFSKRAWLVGAVLLGALFLVTKSPQLLIIAVFALMHRRRGEPDRAELPQAQQKAVAIEYFGLCLFLGAAMATTHALLDAA